METDPRRWITALSASHTRLRTLVESLSPDDLRAPSYDREWTVAQVLSHLGSQAEIFQLFLDAALSGRPVPGNEAFPPVWEVWNQRQPEEQSRECLDANDAFVARLEGLPDETLRRPITVFGMNVTIGDLARMRLSEHAVHSWDIAVSFDPTAQVAADAVALLIDTLTQLVAYAGKPQGRVFECGDVGRGRPGSDLRGHGLRIADANGKLPKSRRLRKFGLSRGTCPRRTGGP